MARSLRLRLSAGLAAGVVVAAVPIAATAASASTGPGPNTLVQVQPGMNASALPDAAPFGSTPASTPETVSFVLREKNINELESAVTQGRFTARNFLSVREFANEYGQSPALISALKGYLGKFGITASADANNIDVVTSGTAGDFDQALSVTQKQYKVPELKGRDGAASIPAQTVHAATGAPELPEYLAKDVLSVLALTSYSSFASGSSHVDTSVLKKA